MEVSSSDLAIFIGHCSFAAIQNYVPLAEHSKKTGKDFQQIFTSAIGMELRNSNPPQETPQDTCVTENRATVLKRSATRLARVAQAIFSEIQDSQEKCYRITSIANGALHSGLGAETFKLLIDNLVHYGLLEVAKEPGKPLKERKIVIGPNYLGEVGITLRHRIEGALKQPFRYLANQRPAPPW